MRCIMNSKNQNSNSIDKTVEKKANNIDTKPSIHDKNQQSTHKTPEHKQGDNPPQKTRHSS